MQGTGRKLREQLGGHVSLAEGPAVTAPVGPTEATLRVAHFDPQTRFAKFRDRFADPEGYLDEVGIERCYELASRGMDVTELARLLQVSNYAFNVWLDKGSARRQVLEEAWRVAAGLFAYEAVAALKRAPGVGPEVTRASQLAGHYRWLASRLDPQRFGDKVVGGASASAQAGLVLNITLADGTKRTIEATVAPAPAGTQGNGDSSGAAAGAATIPGVNLVPLDV